MDHGRDQHEVEHDEAEPDQGRIGAVAQEMRHEPEHEQKADHREEVEQPRRRHDHDEPDRDRRRREAARLEEERQAAQLLLRAGPGAAGAAPGSGCALKATRHRGRPVLKGAPGPPAACPASIPSGLMLRRLYDWTLSLAARPSAPYALGAVSFAESSFFPVPPGRDARADGPRAAGPGLVLRHSSAR